MILPLLVLIVGTWIGAFGMFYIKQGSRTFSVRTVLQNKKFIIGGTLYVISIPLYLIVLRFLPVSVAYPMTSMTYIWSAFLATRFLNEHVTRIRWMGIAFIILGIMLVFV